MRRCEKNICWLNFKEDLKHQKMDVVAAHSWEFQPAQQRRVETRYFRATTQLRKWSRCLLVGCQLLPDQWAARNLVFYLSYSWDENFRLIYKVIELVLGCFVQFLRKVLELISVLFDFKWMNTQCFYRLNHIPFRVKFKGVYIWIQCLDPKPGVVYPRPEIRG